MSLRAHPVGIGLAFASYFFTIHHYLLLSKNRLPNLVKSEEVINKNRQPSIEDRRFLAPPVWNGLAFCGKPRRLKQSTGLLLRAAFRVQQGESLNFSFLPFLCKKEDQPKLILLAPPVGLEPTTHGLTVRRSTD